MEKVAYVKCKFSRSSFPTESIFRIAGTAGSSAHCGAAPLQYCLKSDKTPLSAAPENGEVDGYLVGLAILGSVKSQGAVVRIYLPDGEVYDVSRDQLDYPEMPHVPQRA